MAAYLVTMEIPGRISDCLVTFVSQLINYTVEGKVNMFNEDVSTDTNKLLYLVVHKQVSTST